MNETAILSTFTDRIAAAAFGALIGSAVASIMLGALPILPLGIMIGCVLSQPSVLILAALTELAARLAPTLHASFPLWLASGLIATAPVIWLLHDPTYYRQSYAGEISAGVAGLTAALAAWGFYVRRGVAAR